MIEHRRFFDKDDVAIEILREAEAIYEESLVEREARDRDAVASVLSEHIIAALRTLLGSIESIDTA